MKPFLIQQLERYALRLTELDFLLSREDIMADMTQFLKLSREHAEVSAVASRFAEGASTEEWGRPDRVRASNIANATTASIDSNPGRAQAGRGNTVYCRRWIVSVES